MYIIFNNGKTFPLTKVYMYNSGIDELRLLKCGTPRQIAADRESNTFYYYDFTTTQNSKNVKCSYAAEIFSYFRLQ